MRASGNKYARVLVYRRDDGDYAREKRFFRRNLNGELCRKGGRERERVYRGICKWDLTKFWKFFLPDPEVFRSMELAVVFFVLPAGERKK